MDTSEQTTLETIKQTRRRRRSLEEKRRIVEETLESGASVARVARRHAVNANQVFDWRRLYHAGRLVGSGAAKLLPVSVSESSSLPMTSPSSERSAPMALPGTIHIKLRHAKVRIEGDANPALLRVLLECLRR